MENPEDRTIGQIVAKDYRKADVFEKYGIDFCCHGSQTVKEACRKSGIGHNKLLTELEKLAEDGAVKDNFNNCSIDSLVDYIINNCHEDVRKKLPEIKFYAEKAAEMHGQDHEELFDAYQELLILNNGMINHMKDEEKWLLPFIKKLANGSGNSADRDKFDSADMIEMMQNEHEEVASSINRIRRVSKNYELMGSASIIYQVLFGNLTIFEKNLRKCVHLENNILFPKALNLIQAGC